MSDTLTAERSRMDKVCKKCNETKPVSSFSPHPLTRDGFQTQCKPCRNLVVAEWRKKHKSKVQDYNRHYSDLKYFGGNKALALKRDRYKCVSCGLSDQVHRKLYGFGLSVNHIDHNGRGKGQQAKNNELSNLETLCSRCHRLKDTNYKLDRDAVKQIRSSRESMTTLSKRYGVSSMLIWRIKNYKQQKETTNEGTR